MQIDSEHNKRSFAKIVAMAWASDAFKAALLRDPGTIVREHGMKLPPDTRVVVRDGADPGSNQPTDGGTLELAVPPAPDDLDDEAILSHTNNWWITSAPGFVAAEDAVELTLPPAPEDLADEPIFSQTNNSYISSAPGFVVGEDRVELTLPPAPEDLADEPLFSQTNNSFITSAPGFVVEEAATALDLAAA